MIARIYLSTHLELLFAKNRRSFVAFFPFAAFDLFRVSILVFCASSTNVRHKAIFPRRNFRDKVSRRFFWNVYIWSYEIVNTNSSDYDRKINVSCRRHLFSGNSCNIVNYYSLNVHTAIPLSGFLDYRLLNADCRMMIRFSCPLAFPLFCLCFTFKLRFTRNRPILKNLVPSRCRY